MRRMVFLFLSMMLAPLGSAAQDAPAGSVTGRIPCGDEAACRGVVSLWKGEDVPPDPSRYIMIPIASAPIAHDGSFSISAPPGPYYLGAVRRQGSGAATMGPPRPGDFIIMHADPQENSVEIRAGESVDLGVQDEGWVYEGLNAKVRTGISGRVVDPQGDPVEGVLVFSFENPNMSRTPLAVSERTDAQGRFVLRLPRAAQVYLRVMENFGGGNPMRGGYMGVYGGSAPRRVAVEEGEIVKGLTVEAEKILPFKQGERRRGPSR